MQFHGRYVSELVRSADGEGGGGEPASEPRATPPAQHATRQTFSLEYVQELREEAKGNRVKASAAEQAAEAARAEAIRAKKEAEDLIAAAKAEAEAARATVTTQANQRIILAELKAEAIKAGMIDMDGLKLLDTSAVTLGDDGAVKIPDGFFKAAKEAKPWLFGAAASTSSTEQAPPKQQPGAKPASEWTAEERATFARKHKIRV